MKYIYYKNNSVSIHQRNLGIPAIKILKPKEYLAPKIMSIVFFYFAEIFYNLVISSLRDKAIGLFTKFLQVPLVALKMWNS